MKKRTGSPKHFYLRVPADVWQRIEGVQESNPEHGRLSRNSFLVLLIDRALRNLERSAQRRQDAEDGQ